MISRITISQKVLDARSQSKKRQFNALSIFGEVADVGIVDSYTLDSTLIKKEKLQSIADVLTNKHLEESHIGKIVPPKKFNWLIEIGFLPGVTDNVGNTAKETIEDLLKIKFKEGEAVYYSQIFFITGKLNMKDIEMIGLSLHNPLIQRMRIKSEKEWKSEGDLSIIVPKVILKSGNSVITVNLNVSDEGLARIGKQGITGPDGISRGPLALDLE